MSGGIQTRVNTEMARGVPGQWASTNPRSSYVAGPGGLIAGAGGVTVGNFAWVQYNTTDGDNAPATVNSFGSGPPNIFIDNTQQALIENYLQSSSLTIPVGFGVTGMIDGDYWVINSGTTYAYPGMYAYANFLTGAVTFAATNTAPTTASTTSGYVAAESVTFAGYIVGNTLYVTTATNPVYPGMTLSGTGVTTGTMIQEQLTGTANGIGTYALNIGEQSAGSSSSPITITGTYGQLTVSATLTGTIQIGGILGGSGVAANTAITQQLTGSTGSTGNYVVNNNTVVASSGAPEALTFTTNVATRFVAVMGGGAGETVKISSLASAYQIGA